MKNNLRLAVKLLSRDWRSGELSVLISALIIAVVSTTAISLLTDRLNRTMVSQAAEFLAADMVVTSHAEMSEKWLEKAQAFHLRQAKTIEFASVLMEKDELLLVGVKAASTDYPLRGRLKTTATGQLADEAAITSGPDPGTAWVERRVLTALQLAVGDTVEVGEKPLRVTRILTYEPDKRGNFYSLSPRVLMHADDLAATGIIQPGSHVHYYYLFAGSQENLRQFKAWLKPQLNPGERIMDIHEDRPELGTALTRAERYMGLASIVVILIAGVAIAMASRRYSERHFDVTAILRCLGAKQKDILVVYLFQFALIGLAAGLVGALFGWLAQEGLFFLLKDLLPKNLAGPSWHTLGFSLMTGLLILIGFSLPPILRLRQVAPLKVLRRDRVPLPSSAWLVYGLALFIVALLLWRFTEDFALTFYMLGIGLAAVSTLGLIAYCLLRASRPLVALLSLPWRLGLQSLSRQTQASIGQILAFCITLVAMVVSILVRTDLVDAWQAQLPDNAPNHFAMNIFSHELGLFKNQLKQEKVIGTAFYPIVRGRLVEVNGVDVHQLVVEESEGELAINRDLSLTWSPILPSDNKLVRGTWWDDDEGRRVSVEYDLAKSLKIELGDRLTFHISGQRITARVSSIRTVQWDSMTPNFYMILSPGSLDGFPSTYITSFYLPPENKAALHRLIKTFPHVSLLEVDQILKQFRMILKQVTLAIEYVLLFALLAGFTVLFAAVRNSIDERIYEGALLRTLGASRQLLRRSHLIEFMTLGLLAGLLAAVVAELIVWVLYSRVFDMDYGLNAYVWLMTPISGAIMTGVSGYWSTAIVVKRSPMLVLRDF